MSAKTASLISKILAVLILIGGMIGKGALGWALSTTDIVTIALVVAAVFVTVDINILVDKLTGGKATEVVEAVENAIGFQPPSKGGKTGA